MSTLSVVLLVSPMLVGAVILGVVTVVALHRASRADVPTVMATFTQGLAVIASLRPRLRNPQAEEVGSATDGSGSGNGEDAGSSV